MIIVYSVSRLRGHDNICRRKGAVDLDGEVERTKFENQRTDGDGQDEAQEEM